MKTEMATAVALGYPNSNKPYILNPDSSDVGIGVMLSQAYGGEECVVIYCNNH